MLGRYLDALPARARERIGVAQAWCMTDYTAAEGARCLLGHAEDWKRTEEEACPACGDPDVVDCRRVAGDDVLNWPPLIGMRYDRLTVRCGTERAVMLLKLRVAHPRRELPEWPGWSATAAAQDGGSVRV
jgi:hypothetical protein